MSFPKNIFKAYDIRGLVEGELSEDLAYGVGRAFVVFLKKQNLKGEYVVVGRDMRQTSPTFASAVVRGITDEGWDVLDIGMASTPLFNFACIHYPENVGGIIVTASHNPVEYNGFKMTLGNGVPVGQGNGMEEIRDLVERNDFKDVEKKGDVKTKEVLRDYLNRVVNLVDIKKIKPLKIVIDAGNGMAKSTFVELLKRLPVKVDYLYFEPDGRFPNHEANPLKTETLHDLQKKVLEVGADFGFALDGDADRIGVVDEKGEVVGASFVAALVGLEVLKKHPGALMLYDLCTSKIVREVWEQNGAITEMCPVGHALIKKLMNSDQATFASELSLHLYYRDMYFMESSDLSLLYILQILSRENVPLSVLVAPLKKYWHSGNINFKVEDKEGIMKKVEEKYGPGAKKVSYIDGIWMEFDWGWFNLRPSNTEPILRLTLEANTKELMEEKISEIKKIII